MLNGNQVKKKNIFILGSTHRYEEYGKLHGLTRIFLATTRRLKNSS